MALFLLLFLLGKALSLLVYRLCWSNGENGKHPRLGALAGLLRRPFPWLAHLAVAVPVAALSWDDFPLLRLYASVGSGLLCLGAVGRFGCASLGRIFLGDRVLAVALACAVWFAPVFVYPCLLACCCLQYTVSSWRLGPGYSNLLGFEFVRASVSVIAAGLAFIGWLKLGGAGKFVNETLVVAVLLATQGSSYLNHALAKSALGPRWFSWIRENRLQCLAVNAWLRGWSAGLSPAAVLRLAAWMGRWRVALCAAAWTLEASWLLFLTGQDFGVVLIAATIVFHLAVFAMTGLACFHQVGIHLLTLGLACSGLLHDVFAPQWFAASLIALAGAAAWVGWLRLRMFAAYRSGETPAGLARLADAADHLMAWWDTPFMRMFAYTVETRSGRVFALPVPKLSPHDTALTDIHTHLMVLGLHQDLDPAAEADRAVARTGVWGLAVDRQDRDFLCGFLDGKGEPSVLSPSPPPPWKLDANSEHPSAALPLRALFMGINRWIPQSWFRRLMRWPHFPGEDLAPDICPLVPRLETFAFDEPIAAVTVWRVKTLHTANELILLEHAKVGVITLGETVSPA